MSQYKHLPIYKTSYELLISAINKIRHFPKEFKYSLGDKIRNECINLVILVKLKIKNNNIRLRQSINSYFGYMRYANTYNERKNSLKN